MQRVKNLAVRLQLTIQEAQILLSMAIKFGSDGSNVSRTVWNTMNQTISDLDILGLVDTGQCSLRTCHNAFAAGMTECGNDITNLVIDV